MLPFSLQAILLLVAPNVFMTMAWNGTAFRGTAREPLKLHDLRAALCVLGARYFLRNR